MARRPPILSAFRSSASADPPPIRPVRAENRCEVIWMGAA